MEWPALISTLVAGSDLTSEQAGDALREILAGAATDAQIAGFLIALRMKGESIGEVSAMVDAMLESAAPIELPAGPDAIDIVGTGGSPSQLIRAINAEAL